MPAHDQATFIPSVFNAVAQRAGGMVACLCCMKIDILALSVGRSVTRSTEELTLVLQQCAVLTKYGVSQ